MENFSVIGPSLRFGKLLHDENIAAEEKVLTEDGRFLPAGFYTKPIPMRRVVIGTYPNEIVARLAIEGTFPFQISNIELEKYRKIASHPQNEKMYFSF
jgi:hypothetical protein